MTPFLLLKTHFSNIKSPSPVKDEKGHILLVVPPCFDQYELARILILKQRVKGRTHAGPGRLPGDVPRICSEEDLQPGLSSISIGVSRLLLLLNVRYTVVYTVPSFGRVFKRFCYL